MTPEKELKFKELSDRKALLEANGATLNAADLKEYNDLKTEKDAENAPQGFKHNPDRHYNNANGYSAGIVVGMVLNLVGAKEDERPLRNGTGNYDTLRLTSGRHVSLSSILRGASYALADKSGWTGSTTNYIDFSKEESTEKQMAMLDGKTSIKCVATKQIVGNFGQQTIALWV